MITDKEINTFLKQHGCKLKKLRRKLQLTQMELHKKTGLAQDIISNMENGHKEYTIVSYYKYVKGLRK
jgi:predicted transcriptional regulator